MDVTVYITAKLKGIFGEEYKIYRDTMPQKFHEPCFYVACISSSSKRLVGNRYSYNNLYDVHFFPDPKKKSVSTQRQEIKEKLFDILEEIQTEQGLLRGAQMNTQVIDGVLHFYVNYNFTVLKQVAREGDMEDIEISAGLRKEE